ncbi:helix-turn-helix domain-containing protein [Mycobacterium sp.]|uniref:helix-turn-helix domain-containing protein n=1 Tax=Mycobacterium sp. TaxID=1785 RepID=UPI003C793268
MPDEFDRLWTVNDAARFLHVHPMTIRNLISRRELPCVRVGYAIRFCKEDVLGYIESRTS